MTFRETQIAYRQPWLLWPTCGAIALLIYGVVQQMAFAKPLGNNPVPDLVLLLIAGLFVVFMVVLLMVKLHFTVDSDGVHFSYWPFIVEAQHIHREDILTMELVKYRPMKEYGGWGLRHALRSTGRAYTIFGREGLRITLKDGRHVLLGTQKAEELRGAIARLYAGGAATA